MLKPTFESVLLFLFIAAFLFFGAGVMYDHALVHDVPPGYSAMDYGWKTLRADVLLDQGRGDIRPDYLSAGYVGGVEIYPPLWTYQLALFASTSGFSSVNTAWLLITIDLLIISLLLYAAARKLRVAVALTGLPLAFLALILPFTTARLYGLHPMILGHLFLSAGIFLILGFRKASWFPYVLGVIGGAAFLTHPPEFFYLILVLGVVYLVDLFGDAFSWRRTGEFVFRGAVVVVLSLIIAAYFFPVQFPNVTNDVSEGPLQSLLDNARVQGLFTWDPPDYERIPLIKDFGIMLVFVLSGFLLSLFLKKEKRAFGAVFILLFLLNFVPYLGIKRIDQIRYMWPLYVMFFAGLSISMLSRFVKNDLWKRVVPIGGFLLLTVLFFTIFYTPVVGTAVSKEEWQAVHFLEEQTQPDDVVLYVFDMSFSTQKSAIMFGKRLSFGIPTVQVQALVNEQNYTRYFNATPFSNYRKNLDRVSYASFERIDVGESPYLFGPRTVDLCSFDYYVWNAAFMAQPFAAYADGLFTKLISAGKIDIVFQDNFMFIFKNKGVGGDCFG